MYLLNVGWKWNFTSSLDDLRGVVVLAAYNSSARTKRNGRPEVRRVLFDPQLYLAGLDAEQCAKVCARLASYPWFAIEGLPEFDSGESTRGEWDQEMRRLVRSRWRGCAPDEEAAIRRAAYGAVEVQTGFGCTHVILPAPLCDEREDQGEALGAWLDAGLDAVTELDTGLPILATVPVAEGTLNESAFAAGGLLDALIDQVSSREGLDGVYVVVAQSTAGHPFESSAEVLRAYAYLTSRLRAAGLEIVITNFADVFGLACVGVGASGFASGPTQSLRRLSLAAFRDDGFGLPLPALYSHRVVAELLPESDMPRVAQRRLLGRVAEETTQSAPLIAALRAGASPATIAAWVESQNNVAASQGHFLMRMIEEDRILFRRPATERPVAIQDWLEDAAAGSLYVQSRIGEPPLKGRFAPCQTWLDAIEGAD